MNIEQHYIAPSTKLMNDYINGAPAIEQFFSYKPELTQMQERYHKLKKHPADRQKLSAVLRDYMTPHGLTEKMEDNITAFEEGAPVVVAGQQAGLLTGPLYTVHKAISILLLAKQAEEELNTRVVPVFWIAGEDHDLAEISHLFRDVNGRLDKLNVPHSEYGKNSASSAQLNKPTIESYLKEYFRSLPETKYSAELQALVFAHLERASSYTDFFALLINHFFKEEGLLYIDAANHALRHYETPYFEMMIQQSGEIAHAAVDAEEQLKALGYPATIGAEQDAANLFVTVQGERILLQREGDRFIGKGAGVEYTKDELLDIAKTNPENLSNNVVTRPLMQEMVFPVLAFVGGPGEIAYWAALKNVFQIADMEMPIIMPRLNLTLISRKVEVLLKKYELSAPEVANGRQIPEMRQQLMESIREERAEKLIEEMKQQLEAKYIEIHQAFSAISGGLDSLVEKNLQIHLKQLQFLKNKLEDEVILQNSTQFAHFDLLETELYPNSGFQERVFSPFPYMNVYGLDLIKQLVSLDFKYDKNHKFIYL